MSENEKGILGIMVIVTIVAFALGNIVGFTSGERSQCKTLGAEIHEGKCVIVTRTEVKL